MNAPLNIGNCMSIECRTSDIYKTKLTLLSHSRNRSYSDKDHSSDSDSREDVIVKAPPPKPIRRNPGMSRVLRNILLYFLLNMVFQVFPADF